MELSKAFDTLDQDTLLKKINYYGIPDAALEWFRSYLSHRSQYVELNGHRREKQSQPVSHKVLS